MYVMEFCDDGWYVGTSDRTKEFGTFPGNYVQKIWWLLFFNLLNQRFIFLDYAHSAVTTGAILTYATLPARLPCRPPAVAP